MSNRTIDTVHGTAARRRGVAGSEPTANAVRERAARSIEVRI
ncbi:hypothetical protein ACIA8C_29340 [Nocardia sp. NPDC051321]